MYRLISDLHSEFWPEAHKKIVRLVDMRIPPLASDANTTLLLAGDTGSHCRRRVYRWLIEHLCERFKLVLDIPGNHYWYGGTHWDVIEPPAILPNYVFGHTFVSGEVVAATLWADFERGNPIVEQACRVSINDFQQVDGITVAKVKERHAAHVAFLRQSITPGCVMMTHFAPSLRSITGEFKTSPFNGYYATDLEWLIAEKRPALWVHGHTHVRHDYRIGDTRVVCNPSGYEGRDHDPGLILKLEALAI